MPHLKIIRASAGSGKTFSLTQEYLRLLFAEQDNFMHILAVTFTNKATEEMKTRIVRELHLLSSSQPSKQLACLTELTGLPEQEVRNQAKTILRRLLHHYSGFSVNTIDSFFQKIIRGFTRELGIQGGYSIELDTDILLSSIINRLLVMAETDNSLLTWLTAFAESLIEKGESWDLKKGMRALGGEIFREAFRSFDESALEKYSNRDFLKDYQAELYALRNRIEKEYRVFGRRAAALLKSNGLSVDDFSSKTRGPAGFLVKLETGEFRGPNPTAIQAAANPEKWYAANAALKVRIHALAEKELMPLMRQFIDYYAHYSRPYFTAGVIQKNLYTLGILSDLSFQADTWCNENNAFLLSDAPVFLNRIIDGNDTPFIYEKAGYWFRHFMIDEFQDTSMLQWYNFRPLISNSLSQDYDNLTVGDVKQSIYRWRNSNWEILDSIIHQDFLPGITNTLTLKYNWRSKADLIQFNNSFFIAAAAKLQEVYNQTIEDQEFVAAGSVNTTIIDLYSGLDQEPGDAGNLGGYVNIDCVEDQEETDFSEQVNQKLVALLCELQDKGYRLSDIAILTRKNIEARQTADFLLKYDQKNPDSGYRFDVISDEALQLGSSTVVNFLVGVLKFMKDPTDKTNSYMLQWIGETCLENYNTTGILERPGFMDNLTACSLIEIIERLIVIFRLEKFSGEQVYLEAFRDLILDYSRKNSGEVSRFLEYWDDSGKEKSISAPAEQDAIRILTIHKSKGLEFKITIIPYCSWELASFRGSIIWCKPMEKPFDKLELIPLAFTSRLKDTIFANDYYQEFQRQLIDNLNLLYVAFTRAREGLFVLCKPPGSGPVKNISDLIYNVLGTCSLSRGKLSDNRPEETVRNETSAGFSQVSLEVIADRIRIAFQGGMMIDPAVDRPSRPVSEGKLLHEIFTLVRNACDVQKAITAMQLRGIISQAEQEKYRHLVEQAISDPNVSPWFTSDWHVLNEAEIILPGGGTRRPDRVMTSKNRTLVLDYKFGDHIDSAHEKQVREYASLLSTMGYEGVEAYVWYVRLGRVIKVEG
jgi:ATP-dependent helicase/nuclease subunit A